MTMHASEHSDCKQAMRLAALLDAGDVDAALDAGLVEFSAWANCDADAARKIRAAQAKLANAWAARERFRARERRLQRIAAERAARRAPPAQAQHASMKPASALPASAAAILERAKARAAQKSQQ